MWAVGRLLSLLPLLLLLGLAAGSGLEEEEEEQSGGRAARMKRSPRGGVQSMASVMGWALIQIAICVCCFLCFRKLCSRRAGNGEPSSSYSPPPVLPSLDNLQRSSPSPSRACVLPPIHPTTPALPSRVQSLRPTSFVHHLRPHPCSKLSNELCQRNPFTWAR